MNRGKRGRPYEYPERDRRFSKGFIKIHSNIKAPLPKNIERKQ